jgi:predicted nucleic acid-binding Zn ribbon protein
LVIGILVGTFFVVETITFFSAGRIFSQSMFRHAGWGRIIGLIAGGALVIVATLYGFLNYLSSQAGGFGGGPSTLAFVQYSIPSDSFSKAFSLATAGVYVILAVPIALAFVGFNRLRSQPYYQIQQSQGAAATVPNAMSGRYCPICGNAVPIDSWRCSSCGNWFCPGCGNVVSETSRFCSLCGTKLF